MMTFYDVETPRTEPSTRQVWPPLPKPGEAHKPRAEREPVTLDDVQIGDELSFIVEENHTRRPVERVGKVDRINTIRGRRAAVEIPTDRGRHVITYRTWAEKAPRR